MIRTLKHFRSAIWLAVMLTGCSTISLYDQTAYQQATSLKVDALNLMDKATQQYSAHAQSVSELAVSVDKAHEYDKGRLKNEISARMWERMKDPQENLLGGFIKRWKTSGQLSAQFVTEAKGIVSDAFDTIIQLETQKIKH